MAVVGGVARTPRAPSFIRLKNSRTAAKTQKDPKSRTKGTEQLKSSPWWLVIPQAEGRQSWLLEPMDSGKGSKGEKKGEEENHSIQMPPARRDRGRLDRPTHKRPALPWTRFGDDDAVSVQSTAHVDGTKVGRVRKGATVYADSCRHVIYNTLRTSNRLIKYILYKYISYCTRCPLVQPLWPHASHSSRAVPGRNIMPALRPPYVPHLSLHTGGLREDGQEFASVKFKLWKD